MGGLNIVVGEELIMESAKKLFVTTAIKIVSWSTVAVILSFAFAWIAIVLTGSGEIGLIAMMAGFAFSMYLMAVTYPMLFKKFKKYSEGKRNDQKSKTEI